MTKALRDHIQPLRTLDPADPDTSDLAPLAAAIGDARIACIGESLHCAREFYLLKDRLFRYLVTEHGFTAFVLESGFAEGLRLNEWVQGGAGDLHELSRNAITWGLGEGDEMRAQLQWMRDWNAQHDRKIRFYGLDLGGSAVMPHRSAEVCLSRLPGAPGDEDLLASLDLGERHVATKRWTEMSEAQQVALVEATARLVDRAEQSGDEIALRCARSAAIIVGAGRRFEPGSGENPRDDYMADMVRWIAKREDRILIGAHNGHIQRALTFGNPTLGVFLAQTDEAVVIGATAASGPYVHVRMSVSDNGVLQFDEMEIGQLQPPDDSLDAIMQAEAGPLGFLNLRTLPADRLQGEMPMLMMQNQTFPIDVRKAFDALVHVGSVSVCEEMLQSARAGIRRANRVNESGP